MEPKSINQVGTTSIKAKIAEPQKENKGFLTLLQSMKSEIQKAIPKHLTVERVMRIAQSAFSSNSKLQSCDPMTIITGVMSASQMGLEINTPLGEAYLIPYNGKAEFQIGYRGHLNLAYRTGSYKMIGVYCVYENEVNGKDGSFVYELGLDQKLKHIPAIDP